MPRHSRIKSKTNIYHVMNRGLNKQLLFDDEVDYLRYLQLINDIKKEFGIKVYAYCLMSNHVHMLVKDVNEKLSFAMRRLNSRYAMYYNKKNDRVGYVFSDRYKSEVIEKLLQFSNTRRISEYRNMEEPIKMLLILKLIDEGISMM